MISISKPIFKGKPLFSHSLSIAWVEEQKWNSEKKKKDIEKKN